MTRVLVVDDTPALRMLLAEALVDAGFEAQAAAHGEEALRIAETWRPDAIVLDLMMPVMDGPTFLMNRRQLPWLRAVPVLVLTAQPAHDRLLDGLDATVILRKPYDLDQLIDAIRALAAGETGRGQVSQGVCCQLAGTWRGVGDRRQTTATCRLRWSPSATGGRVHPLPPRSPAPGSACR